MTLREFIDTTSNSKIYIRWILANSFDTGRHFDPSQIFASMALVIPSGGAIR